ncbi:MAG: SBBP repeat-containing protein [Bryobacterales bacterium]|nr:SBBP repeat-containing protein [Bryobacterales bacterium]
MLRFFFFVIFFFIPAEAAKTVSGFGDVSIHFEPTDEPGFDYVSRSGRYALLVNSREARFLAPDGDAITMRLAGARAGEAKATRGQGVSHYYLGAGAKRWRSAVPHYSRVRWTGVYRGIDVVYYGNGREVEFDFEVSGGADASRIRMSFEGARSLRINEQGALELATSRGVLMKRPPVAYQRAGNGQRRPVDVRYALEGNEVTFELGGYDRRRALTIDPSVAYATYLGGEGLDTPTGLAVDGNGSAYVAGRTNSAFFPGAGFKASPGEVGFVTKLTPAGNGIVYSLYVGGIPGAIAVDSGGTVYLSGLSSGGLAVKNAFQAQVAGQSDAFVAKFDSGGALVFATYLGGSGAEEGNVVGGVRFDATGALYVAGGTRSTDFPVKNAAQAALGGGLDAFYAKLDAAGALVHASYLGGAGDDFANGFDLDPRRNPVVAGRTLSTNFPVTQDAQQANRTGFSDGFLTRADGAGGRLLYSSYLGGIGFSSIDGLAVAQDGTMAITAVGSLCGGTYWCIGRLSASNEFRVFFSSRNIPMRTVAFDSFGNLVATGMPTIENVGGSPDVPLVNPVRRRMVGDDALLMHFRPDGQMLFSTFWGGAVSSLLTFQFHQYPVGAVADTSGGLYLLGATNVADIFTSGNAVQRTHAGGAEAFLAKFVPGFEQTVTAIQVRAGQFIPITVDGQTTPGLRYVQALPGTTLQVEVPQRYETSFSRHVFQDWSNGGSRSQTVSVGVNDLFLSARFVEDVKIQTAVEPAGAGTVEITPASADGFYRLGSSVTLKAKPAPGFVFTSWSGDLGGGTADEQSRLVYYIPANGPLRVTAKFVPGVPPPNGLSFVPVTPCRVMDTRPEYGFTGPFGGPVLEGGATREVPVTASPCGIPQSAKAYAVSLTAVPLEPLGYLSAFATGQARPGTSTLNSNDGQIVANAAIVQAGGNGSISLFASNRTHVLVDITGYFAESVARPLTGSPVFCRALDTRPGTPLQAGEVRQVSSCPFSGEAALVRVTAYPRGRLRWLSIASGTPAVSTLNSLNGEVRSNTSLVALQGNAFSIQASDTTDVTVDIEMVLHPAGFLRFYPVAACRLVDTREGGGGPVPAGASFQLPVVGRCNIPPGAMAAAVNATVIPSGGAMSLQLGPSQMAAPAGRITANLMFALASGGVIEAQPSGAAHFIFDVMGYFAP